MQKQAHSRARSTQGPSQPCCLASATLRAGSHSPWGCRVAATPGYRVTSGRKSVPGTYRPGRHPLRPLPCSRVTRPVT